MVMGVALGNSQVLRDPGRHAGFWKWLLECLPVGLVLALLVTLSDYGRLGRFGDATAPWRHALDQGIVLLVALGYAALFVFLFSRARWHRWLRHLAPVGRMALSNYLGHTVVGIAVFYGIGLGIGPRYRSEEHTSELQSLMRISYAVFCLKKKKPPIQYYK